MDFTLSAKSRFLAPPGDIECGSLDDIARQAQPTALHQQHGAYHHG